jgi:hypothetical protein
MLNSLSERRLPAKTPQCFVIDPAQSERQGMHKAKPYATYFLPFASL